MSVKSSVALQNLINTQYFYWTSTFPDFTIINNSNLPVTKNTSIQDCFQDALTRYFPDFTLADIKSLRTKQIIYTKQVTDDAGFYLLLYPNTEAINHQGPVPQWYNKLQTETSIGPNQVLITPLKNPISKILPIQRSINFTPIIITDTQLPIPASSHLSPNDHPISEITDSIIKQSLLGCNTTLSRLQDIKSSHQPFRHFTFFTDGSVKHLTSQNCHIGFGWIETEANIHTSHFYGRTTYLPSATKAKTMALVTAILTVLPNSFVSIHTDLTNLISSYRRFIEAPIFKAHSNNISNDMADHLAKQGCDLQNPIQEQLLHLVVHSPGTT
ncbi:hypothetical protein C1645_811070 [Glomus cerebriforme]|uniref:RNase H type-1 domain-containing protein n=1 Tax=Glomus cerebriforme TaxID=658196 RepID=A0A397TP28_9GLOM|nr:hypothetical protein C1645_811070 [Glomus cerebriforme]